LVAALNVSRPRFRPFFYPIPSLPPSHLPGLNISPIPDGPLYGDERLNNVLAGSPFGSRGIRLLQRMRDLTTAILGPANHTPIEPIQLEAVIEGRDDYYLVSRDLLPDSVPPADLTDAETAPLLPYHLLAPLMHAAAIYERAIFPLLLSSPSAPRQHIPFASQLNHQALEALVQSLQFPTHDATFAQYPGVLVWILLVGAAAAEGREERGFLVMFLARVGTGSGYSWWNEMRETVERFRAVRGVTG
jgi:hypothetical protein